MSHQLCVTSRQTNTHRRRPTVKKRLQVCRGIHLCVWYLSSSVLFWSDGFHKLYHEVRVVIFFSRDSVPAQISAGVSNPFEYVLYNFTSTALLLIGSYTQSQPGNIEAVFTGAVWGSESTSQLWLVSGLGSTPLCARGKKKKKKKEETGLTTRAEVIRMCAQGTLRS